MCRQRGLDFQHRLIVNAYRSTYLVGELKPEVTLASSFYDERRKFRRGTGKDRTGEHSLDQKRTEKEGNEQIRDLSNELRRRNKTLHELERQVVDLKNVRRNMAVGSEQQEAYRNLKRLKLERCQAQAAVNDIKQKLNDIRSRTYKALSTQVHSFIRYVQFFSIALNLDISQVKQRKSSRWSLYQRIESLLMKTM